jgi:phosphohistidine swiveling domain-containing protein
MISPTRSTTKATAIDFLRRYIKKSHVEEHYFFDIAEWKNKESIILSSIMGQFKNDKIVVRSSAIGEDSTHNSMAGNFESILNVDSSDSSAVHSAITAVISSYRKKHVTSALHQVLVQRQTKNIAMSGVLFTRGADFNSPYYIINYDDTGSTDMVTAGLGGKALKVYRNADYSLLSTSVQKLIESVEEISELFEHAGLDIEFAITHNDTIVIFQVRAMTTLHEHANMDSQVSPAITFLKQKVNDLSLPHSHMHGKRTILADMPDWNPAEIIGDTPQFLDFSLYNYIITDTAWHEARTSQGYKDVSPAPLVTLIGNKPYVDVRSSFNSFLPKDLPEALQKKLISFYMQKLKNNPELQDKVEFEILYTCYDFDFNSRSSELLQNGFSSSEVETLKKSLLTITNNLVLTADSVMESDMKSLEEMRNHRVSFDTRNLNHNVLSILNFAQFLLDECRTHGTVQFSRLARLGFVGKILLKSLAVQQKLPADFESSFMSSVKTVAGDFTLDLAKAYSSKHSSSFSTFASKYAHLRPGTYDITSQRYASSPHFLKPSKLNISFEPTPSFSVSKTVSSRISDMLSSVGLKFDTDFLFDFIRKSIEYRELSKFEFTKNLSDAIELIAIAGAEMGFSREDLSFLSLDEILKSEITDQSLLSDFWKARILERKYIRSIYSRVNLPSIIFSDTDLDSIVEYVPRPNFITQLQSKGKLVHIENSAQGKQDLKGKIVMIENGDPGYDWIFTKSPAGLITKYGGVASHMAIRCAEFNLPAAIGCGSLFDKLKNSSGVVLDSKLKKIIPFG